jgi:hypothetical protein
MDEIDPVDPEMLVTSGYDVINGPTVMKFHYDLTDLTMSHQSKYEKNRSVGFRVIGFFVLVCPKKGFPSIVKITAIS